jgi:2,2-dialkylglycine decarboxylase (pyruvate)
LTVDIAEARDLLVRYGGDQFERAFVRAKGTTVWDDQGREILDFTSGQMCATIGHNHPALIGAMQRAGETAVHLFSGMIPQAVLDLAVKLQDWLPKPLKRVLPVNTGAESNEAALRLAKLATGGYEVMGLGGSWHGVTGGAAQASYASDRKGYGPKVPGGFLLPEPNAYRCPIGHCRDACDMSCLKVGLNMFDMARDGSGAAIITEPILSAGGVIVPPDGYLGKLKKAAHDRGMLMIFDEAQTACGRIGARTAAEATGVTPDILTMSKTIGGGLPLAVTATSDAIEEQAHRAGFTFYTSHVADPLPALAGIAVLETIEREGLIEAAIARGAYLRAGLQALQQKYEAIGDIRGQGLLIGVELVEDRESRRPNHRLGAVTTEECFRRGLSMNIRRRPERGAVWRIAPPLTVTEAEIDRALEILDTSLAAGLDRVARDRAGAPA